MMTDAEFLRHTIAILKVPGMAARLTAIAERLEALDAPPNGELWGSFMHHVGCDKCDAKFSRETHRQGSPCPVCQPPTPAA